jgi:hypothetical protein
MNQYASAIPLITVQDTIDAHAKYAAHLRLLSDRMNYIVHYVFEKVGGKVDWWDWGNEDNEGDFIYAFSPKQLEITGSWNKGEKTKFVSKSGEVLTLDGYFPTRWLYEDFEEEYTRGLQLYVEKMKEKKNKTKNEKEQEKQALLTSARSKLTPEEIKALGL